MVGNMTPMSGSKRQGTPVEGSYVADHGAPSGLGRLLSRKMSPSDQDRQPEEVDAVRKRSEERAGRARLMGIIRVHNSVAYAHDVNVEYEIDIDKWRGSCIVQV